MLKAWYRDPWLKLLHFSRNWTRAHAVGEMP
jgi:hypothetical protein